MSVQIFIFFVFSFHKLIELGQKNCVAAYVARHWICEEFIHPVSPHDSQGISLNFFFSHGEVYCKRNTPHRVLFSSPLSSSNFQWRCQRLFSSSLTLQFRVQHFHDPRRHEGDSQRALTAMHTIREALLSGTDEGNPHVSILSLPPEL